MAKRASKKTSSGARQDGRRNGKAFKKNPGVAPKAHNGKSVGGYSKKHAIKRITGLSKPRTLENVKTGDLL